MLGLEGLLVIILIILISACYYSELRIAIKTRKEIKERKKKNNARTMYRHECEHATLMQTRQVVLCHEGLCLFREVGSKSS